MSPSVAVVTDSTAYLDESETARWGITVVPLQAVVGERTFDDMTPIDAAALASALRDRSPITTSRPAPGHFAGAYETAAARGASGVVSIHLSGEMSGTVDSARIAARDAPIPVEVIDSRSIAMGLGFPVLAAAQAARTGAPLADVASAARRCADAARTFFYVDTLDYLRRGGRIGAIRNLVGSALAIKPLMHLGDGTITLLEKVRTASRAIARLEGLAVEAAGEEPVNVAVQHLMAAGRAEALAESLTARLPKLVRMTVVEVGPVLGVHTGPGTLGVTISPPVR
ncbi:DegV family protein [Planotetraspora sp. A-T 1434]|uniref:DegV family protein n=1 Tax=Planotetraspora sp. A-T 1434 TaxID=2979219 RepID=UPI0021BF7F8F|nr:DegV family protein [Planotetraspora sp. A-T 1434]MCT9932954.1 DegV family protein [Planotetraspora sp. A-T 1434]